MLHVLDASAALALLLDERGAEVVAAALETACIGSVNVAEVATILIRRGGDADQVREVISTLVMPIWASDTSLAIDAGLLWTATKAAGSSLGDRYCLVLAQRLNAVLLTSDQQLAAISPIVGVRAVMIR